MKLPRDLDADDLVKVLCRDWSYSTVHQVGSHVVLQTEVPTHQRMAIPRHAPIRVGTLAAIVRSVALHKGVSKDRIVQSIIGR